MQELHPVAMQWPRDPQLPPACATEIAAGEEGLSRFFRWAISDQAGVVVISQLHFLPLEQTTGVQSIRKEEPHKNLPFVGAF